MKSHSSWILTLAAASCLLMFAGARADEKKSVEKKKGPEPRETVVNGELINADLIDKVRNNCYCKSYTFKMTEGRNYQIDMKSTDFDSYLRLEDPAGQQVAADDDSGGFPDARIMYRAPKSGEYQIIATTFGANSTGKFKLIIQDLSPAGAKNEVNPLQPKKDGGEAKKEDEPVKKPAAKPIELKIDKTGAAKYDGTLTVDDLRYKGMKLHKLFLFKMEENKLYKIDLSSKSFDAYLILEDPKGKVVEQNDDNGESLDSRIIYRADQTGIYRIVATSLNGQSRGDFTLTVRPASEEDRKQAELKAKIQKLFLASAAERKETVQELTKYLEAKGAKTNRADLQLVMGVGQVLEFAKDEKSAGAAFAQFSKLLAKSDNPQVADMAKSFEGFGRRLSLVGNEMPLKGKLLDGKAFDLKDLKGKVVLVDFWATWCPPCRAEIPNMKKLYAKYNKQGFEVIGISLDDSEETLKKFIAKEEIPWNSIFDVQGKRGEGIADMYGILSIPQAILVGRDGRVVSLRARGPELERLLESLIEEKK